MPVPSTAADLSTTAASNSPAGPDAIGTSLDDYLRSIQAIIKQQDSKGSDIASATTIDVPAAGKYFVVTGTTTIAGISDDWNGRVVVLKFSGALQLTHSASFILPGSANITTAAGDCLMAVNESTGVWRVVVYQSVSGFVKAGAVTTSGLTMATSRLLGRTTASTGAIEEITVGSGLTLSAGTLTGTSISGHGQCRLTKSGANLLLSPYNGNKLIINGTTETIPSAGVTLAAPATTNTTYFIYAYMNAGTMTLEASATGHATDSTTGVEIKSGDATRTLVGMARTVSSAWVDSATQRFVISYFNRRPINGNISFGATSATSSGSFVELNSANRVEFLTWGDSACAFGGAGAATHGTAGYVANYYAVGVDGGTLSGGYTQFTTPGIGPVANASVSFGQALAEGYHYITVMGATASGTVTFQASYTNQNVMVQG